ncbi:sialoadhesin-like isoform X2 [Festucalex cinctus]
MHVGVWLYHVCLPVRHLCDCNWCSGGMKNHTLVFFLLAFLLTASQCLDLPFEVSTQSVSIKEGSCIELTLTSNRDLPGLPVNWFWMKDSYWSASQNKFIGTVILSSDTNVWPVHPDFVGRVKIQDSLLPSQIWHAGTSLMSLMCDIKKSDNGSYSFIYQLAEGSPWAEASVVVKVEDNPCLVDIVHPTAMGQLNKLLFCNYNSQTCPVNLQLLDDNLPIRLPLVVSRNRIIAQIPNDWQNDGKKIVCQVQGNTDEYLRKYVTLDIPYSPNVVNVSFSEGVRFVQEGDSMMLVCTANGNPAPTFEWFKNDESLVKAARWLVSSASIKHSGKYKCVATNEWGSNESTIDVDIKYLPTVGISSNETTVKRGQNLLLSCLVKGGNPWPDTFSWYKDDKLIASQKDSTYLVESPVLREHKGRYKCKAYNAVYTEIYATSAPLLIDVEYMPRDASISIMGSANTEVKAGTSVMLQCTADANPKPYEYVWTLFSQDGPLLETLPDNKEHLLREMQPSDRFCYACSATNAVGASRVSEQLCIHVLYGPTNLGLHMPDKVPEGEMVFVLCLVESVPLSHLTLTRTARDQLSAGSVAAILDETSQNNVLSYSFKATWTDGGVYECEANNTEGRGSTQKTLQVTYAPRNVAVKANPSLVVNKNSMLKLQCVADSNPPIESVTWWKADSMYQNEADIQALIMTHITPDHAGIYSCVATNELGSARSPPVKVKVYSNLPEPVLSMPSKITEGELVSMLCSVQSDLLAVLTFTRVNSKLSSDWPGSSSHGNPVKNNTLSHTFKATSADSGVYVCEAGTAFGKRSTQKTLQVTYAPKDVAVRANSSLVLAENAKLVLQCDADSNPPVESVMWWKVNDTKPQNLPRGQTLTIESVKPADAGLYGCTATNEVGSASSPPVEVKIQNLKLMEVAMAIGTDWIMMYIVAPFCGFLIVAFILICVCRVKRRSKRVLNISETAGSNADNTESKFSYSMINLSSVGKDPSATNMGQKEPPKENPLPDCSFPAEYL